MNAAYARGVVARPWGDATITCFGHAAGAVMQSISFRVASKSEPGLFHTVTVQWPGPTAVCECGGFDGTICSHIDATLVAGERAMVPEEDRAWADEAMKAMTGLIVVPKTWKASWRWNYGWRGLPTRKIGGHRRPAVGLSGKPIVCFTGAMPRPRPELLQEAEAEGWETVDRPHPSITVLVAAEPNGGSNKLQFARECGIPILTFEDWNSITAEGEIIETGEREG